MEQIADDVFQFPMLLRQGVNAYLIGDVLVDAGGPPFGRRIAQELRVEERALSAHIVTHARGDHAGGSHSIVEECKVPVWAGAADVAVLESGNVEATGLLAPVMRLMGGFEGVPVRRALHDGDEVGAGFVVLETPGRTPGHIALWRERDRVLLCGDVWLNMDMKTTRRGLRDPARAQTIDREANRRSQARLAALQPAVVGFGHGPVLDKDAAGRLAGWVA
ncbi:MAG: beta-lactamase domain protein [Solirubrobacterales bacterium]|nr:beta-lactamase domain protein [Solirubrobacterales bacterium]